MEDKYKLLENGKVEYTYKTEISDFNPEIMDKEKIGVFYNMGVTIIDNKSMAVELLEKSISKTEEDLKATSQHLSAIDINDSLAEELKVFIDNTVKIMEAIKEVKDLSNEKYVANNPKKFGKVVREVNELKSNLVGELKEIDKITGLHTKKKELLKQQKLFSEQLEKMKRQHKEVIAL